MPSPPPPPPPASAAFAPSSSSSYPELLPVGVPERGAPRASTVPPRNAKHDPAWAPRAANALADARGAAPEDVARTLAELRATQDAVAKSLLDTEDAVLWLQKLEWLELQLTLIPRYRKKAVDAAAGMREIERRLARAKARASKLSGEVFPEYEKPVEKREEDRTTRRQT